MSDVDVGGSLKVSFPDGTSKVFRGTSSDEINGQAKAYWQSRHPAPKATPAQAPVSLPPAIPRASIDAYRLQNFNSDNPNANINLKMAHALAANPKDPSYLHRYRNLDPVAQRAIAEKADEIAKSPKFTEVNTAGLGPGGIPGIFDKKGNQAPIEQPSKVLAGIIHGPEGARQLEQSKGFGPEVERVALGTVDPESVLMMLTGGTIGSVGPWASRGVTAAFSAAMGKGAYDKLQAGDPGGAFADLSIAGLAVGGHALAEKMFAKGPKLKEPPPPNPTTARVQEPSGLGPGPEPTPESPQPEPEPPKEPPKAKRPKSPQGGEQTDAEAKARDAGKKRRQEQKTNSQEYQDRQRQRREQDQEKARQSRAKQQPPPGAPPQPEGPYAPVDPGTPHPEVDRFNEHEKQYAPNIGESADIVAAKGRLADLVAKRKLTVNEKAERVILDNKINTHLNALNDFSERFKAATGKDPGIKTGTWSDKTTPSGRAEVVDKIRQSLRTGQSTFEKMFPDVPKPEPAAEAPGKSARSKKTRKTSGMLDLGPGEPGSPQERFTSWLKEHVGDIGGAIRFAAGEPPTENVSRETTLAEPPKPARFTALDEDTVDVTKNDQGEVSPVSSDPGEQGQSLASPQAESLPQNVDDGHSVPDAKAGKRPGKRSSRTAGFIDIGPLPPKAGSGPVGRVLHHGSEITNAINKFDASSVSNQVRGKFLEEQLYQGLDPVQKDALDEWLIGNRFRHEANTQTDPVKAAAIRAHPQYVSDADLANLASFPGVQDAIDRYKDEIKPVIDELSEKAGVSAQAIAGQSPHYVRLVPTDILNRGSGTGARASWESRGRPKSTGARKAAKVGAREYSTDVGAILRHVLRDVEPKAALNDLWRTLDAQGKVKVQPSGTAGRGWRPPDGYVGDEVQGKFSSMPADLKAKYGERSKVYLPQDIVQSMDEVTAPKKFSGERGVEIAGRVSRALISTTLGLNVPAVPWHIYRQTARFRASTALADAKRNPATLIAGSIPIVGAVMKGIAVASRNADDPTYKAAYQYLVEINAISPRSMEGLTENISRLPLVERWQAILHDSMFGVPHGRGFNGWAGRIAVEAFLARGRFEGRGNRGVNDEERDREYIARFGAYVRRVSPWFGVFADLNPFVRTHAPGVVTSLKLAVGDTGLKTTRNPGESATTWRMRQAADRIGAFALIAAVPIVGLVVLNKVLSGKYPWENGKGHDLDLSLGHGHYIPLGRILPELGPALELSGMNSRARRAKGPQAGVTVREDSAGVSNRVSASKAPPSPVMDALTDMTIGAGNVAIGAVDSPALNAGAALLNRRMYVQYDSRQKSPNLMALSPTNATPAQRAVNTLSTIVGTNSIVPTLGYKDDPEWNIGTAFLEYLIQGAVKKDYSHDKGAKTKKIGR